MIDTLYIEEAIREHPRVLEIMDRFPQARHIFCERYTEIFNRKNQNFRLQKKNPALILARKHHGFVLPAPAGYGIGGQKHYYFSHMLNCLYDCRYCFLQGMYRSANYVLFVNYEDFQDEIRSLAEQCPEQESWFFSGYDCDSLALEPVSHFVEAFLPVFSGLPNAWLELRTKSTQIRSLLRSEVVENCVVAFSFTPDEVAQAVEHRAPSVKKRLDAMVRLQSKGWKLGLRFDPLIYQEGFESQYRQLFEDVFARIDRESLHSVSLGTFRLPKNYFRTLSRLYPDEPLMACRYEENQGMVSYPSVLETQMKDFCSHELLTYIPEDKFFPCVEA